MHALQFMQQPGSVEEGCLNTCSRMLSGQDLLQILSQQDQRASGPASQAGPGEALHLTPEDGQGSSELPDQTHDEEDDQEHVAAAAAHLVGKADGTPTNCQDEELRDALAAETEHMVWHAVQGAGSG